MRVIPNLNPNIFQIFQLLIMFKNGFISAYDLFLLPYSLFEVLILFFFEHCAEDCVAGSLIHFQHTISDHSFHGTRW